MDYAKVLIIDKNVELYEYSTGIWVEYGIKTHRVNNIEQALEEVSVYKYHLIIIVECKEQRPFVLDSIKLFHEITVAPIVIASTDSIDPEYRINGFNMGADEVWEMPENIEVAVAKGCAIIRRYLQLNKEIDKQSTIIVNKNIVLSTAQRLVYVKGNKIELPRLEFNILTFLISQPGKVFTYEQIFREVWGEDYTETSREVLRTQIYKLRESLKIDSSLPNYIKTNLRVGYSFAPEYDK